MSEKNHNTNSEKNELFQTAPQDSGDNFNFSFMVSMAMILGIPPESLAEEMDNDVEKVMFLSAFATALLGVKIRKSGGVVPSEKHQAELEAIRGRMESMVDKIKKVQKGYGNNNRENNGKE